MRILLLEDESGMRRRIKMALAEYDYIVEDFRRIDIAKEYFLNNSKDIDLVIMDLNMDDEFLGEYRKEALGGAVSGWVFLQRFILPIEPDLPIIVFSDLIDLIDISVIDNSNIHLMHKTIGTRCGITELISLTNKILK